MDLPFGIPSTAAGGAAGMAGIGIIVGMWGKIKLYASKIFSLLVIKVETDSYTVTEAFKILLMTEFKCSPLGTKKYGGEHEYVRPIGRNQLVSMEIIPKEPTVWWRGRKPLIVSVDGHCLTMTFIRGVYKRDDLFVEAENKFNEEKHLKDWRSGDRFRVRRKFGSIGMNKGRAGPQEAEMGIDAAGSDQEVDKRYCRPLQWDREELGQPKKASPMDALCLTEDQLGAIEEALRWRDSEDWFKDKGVPWKRGWLMEGAPGTGKTAFIRALGQELNMPIYLFDLATMTNQDFNEAWESVMGNVPCIPLFEDIDGVFDGRDNIAVNGMENGLSFDCFLNSIDGVENTDGCFIVITTNHMEKIDPAIGVSTNGDSTRPGRVDRVINFVNLTQDGKEKMASRILGGFDRDLWTYLLDDDKELTGAQFQDRCSKLALKLFWEEKDHNE
jgi:hypothetical protein